MYEPRMWMIEVMTIAFTLITWGICFSSRLTLMNSTILSKLKLGFHLRRKPKDKHETVHFSRESRLDASIRTRARIKMAWETIRHFATPPLVSPRTSADIPYWWHIITRILVEPLIGWKFASTNQKHYSDLGSDASSVWNFCARLLDVIPRGNQW